MLERLVKKGRIVPCSLENPAGRPTLGWIRPADLELAGRLKAVRPRDDRGVLLSPFDPLLWDRARVKRLFDFDQVLEIFKPAPPKRSHRRATLPPGRPGSTIAEAGLNFRVRNGNGCGPCSVNGGKTCKEKTSGLRATE